MPKKRYRKHAGHVSKYPRLRDWAPPGAVTVRRATDEELGYRPGLPDTKRFADAEMRWKVLERDRFLCRYCGQPVTFANANIDHVIAWKRGGQTVPVNLVAACRDCNKAKGNNRWTPGPIGGVHSQRSSPKRTRSRRPKT